MSGDRFPFLTTHGKAGRNEGSEGKRSRRPGGFPAEAPSGRL